MPSAVAAWAWMKMCRGAESRAWARPDLARQRSRELTPVVSVWAVEQAAGFAELVVVECQTNHAPGCPEALDWQEVPEA